MSVVTSNEQDFTWHNQEADGTWGYTENYEEGFCRWQSYTVEISNQVPERPFISRFKEIMPSNFKKIHFFSSLKSGGIW